MDLADRFFKMVNYIIVSASIDELEIPPNYGLHQFSSDKAGTFAMTITRNWSMIFPLNGEGAIIDFGLEDYQ